MSNIGNSPKFSAYQPDYFSGTGAQTVFVMNNAVATSGSIIVVVDGVKQLANTYSVSGVNLTFSEAPPNGSSIEVNYLALKGVTTTVTAAKGGGSDDVFYENSNVITTNYTITAGKNAMSAGPVTINNGVTVTVPNNSTWSIV